MPPDRLHTAAVVSHRPTGRGYYRLVLRAPAIADTAAPGQFVMLRVNDTGDPLLARPFGICSCPSRGSIEILYRVVGRGTSLLTRARSGQELTIVGPLGSGFPKPARGTTPVCISGGSGFPPLHFFAIRSGRGAHFLAGARTKECLPPVRILSGIRSRGGHIHIATDDGSAGFPGTSTDLLQGLLAGPLQNTRPVLYCCGPHAMLAAVGRIAREHGIPCYVSTEERMACGLGVCMGCAVPMKSGGYKRACKEGPVFDSREIDWQEQVPVRLRT